MQTQVSTAVSTKAATARVVVCGAFVAGFAGAEFMGTNWRNIESFSNNECNIHDNARDSTTALFGEVFGE